MMLEKMEARRLFAVALPGGFTETALATGLNQPTSLAELPDGRLLVTQKSGALRLIKPAGLTATPVLTLTPDSAAERGLLAVAPDPAFAANHYIYVYYFPAGTNAGRISRFTMSGDTAQLSTEVVLLNLDPQAGSMSHAGGAIHFGTDGKLYIATGDNQNPANSQSLADTHGKLLRINSNGTIPVDNPFVATTTGAAKAIYAYGLRNPFTFGVNSTNGTIYINDVGEKSFEEIDAARSGANFGWPNTEGPTNDPAYDAPVYAYAPPAPGVGVSINGGAFYAGVTQQFPTSYAGKYFFGDYVQGTVRTFDPATKTASPFATGLTKMIDIDVRPDGTMLCLTYDGIVHAIKYAPSPNTGALRGFTFNDGDRSGTYNSGDGLATGKTVFLDLDNDNTLDTNETRVVTDGSGNFAFTGLAAGTYHVRRVFPSGYTASTPPIDVAIAAGQTASGLSIGSQTTPVQPPLTATFSGFVINDTNKDGKWTSGEKGIAGRTVWIDLDNDGTIDANEAKRLADSNGRFTFEGLAAGTYKFREVVPTGWRQTSPANGYGLTVTLTAGQVKSGASFQVTTV